MKEKGREEAGPSIQRSVQRKVFTDESGQSWRPKLVAKLGLENEDHILFFFPTTECCHFSSVLLKKMESLKPKVCLLTAGLCRGEGLPESFRDSPTLTNSCPQSGFTARSRKV